MSNRGEFKLGYILTHPTTAINKNLHTLTCTRYVTDGKEGKIQKNDPIYLWGKNVYSYMCIHVCREKMPDTLRLLTFLLFIFFHLLIFLKR